MRRFTARNIAAVGLVLIAPALCAEGPAFEPFGKLTDYDQAALGEPKFDERQNVAFPGSITITGQLRIEADESCDGACAYLLPDDSSAVRLPKRIPAVTQVPIPIENILVSDGRTALVIAVGETAAESLLNRPFTAFQYPATVTITNFQIERACDATHYVADLVDVELMKVVAQAIEDSALGGC